MDLKAVLLMGVPRGPRHVVRLAGRTDGILSFDPTRITPLSATISVAHLPGTFLAYDDFGEIETQPGLELLRQPIDSFVVSSGSDRAIRCRHGLRSHGHGEPGGLSPAAWPILDPPPLRE